MVVTAANDCLSSPSLATTEIPIGTAGILGLDFLALFDWDFDVRSEKAGPFLEVRKQSSLSLGRILQPLKSL